MLHHIDAMIGFSVVMLLLSLLVTVLVQGVIAVTNLRGLNLLWGLKSLLVQISQIKDAEAELMAKEVLKHPTVSHAWQGWWDSLRYARAIRSDEIVKIITDLTERPGLKSAANNVLANVGARETAVWASMLEHELDQLLPVEADKARQVLDRLKERITNGKDGFKDWYDTVMDRTSERFVTHTRAVTLACAAALSFGLSIDSLYVFERFSGDAELRARLLQSAETSMRIADDLRFKSDDAARAQIDALHTTAKKIQRQITKDDLPLTPAEPYQSYWKPRHLIGMFATMLLLSLGAPFWFNLLGQLANLRPLIAGKVDRSEAHGS